MELLLSLEAAYTFPKNSSHTLPKLDFGYLKNLNFPENQVASILKFDPSNRPGP